MCLSRHDVKIVTDGLASNDALERTACLLDKMSEFVDPRVFEKMNQNKLLQHIQK